MTSSIQYWIWENLTTNLPDFNTTYHGPPQSCNQICQAYASDWVSMFFIVFIINAVLFFIIQHPRIIRLVPDRIDVWGYTFTTSELLSAICIGVGFMLNGTLAFFVGWWSTW